ncbi:MAG TPA: multidrug efflux SMR transporter [Victivallales bacterium]|nr:multidrug efflux SMR transporter [Victivallales bacterium]
MVYVLFSLAIISEVVATTAMKASDGFTKTAPSIVVVIGYAIAFYSLSLLLKNVPIGIAYAIWSGMGIVFVTFISIYLYKQIPDLASVIGIGFIIVGVIVINVFSNIQVHH